MVREQLSTRSHNNRAADNSAQHLTHFPPLEHVSACSLQFSSSFTLVTCPSSQSFKQLIGHFQGQSLLRTPRSLLPEQVLHVSEYGGRWWCGCLCAPQPALSSGDKQLRWLTHPAPHTPHTHPPLQRQMTPYQAQPNPTTYYLWPT